MEMIRFEHVNKSFGVEKVLVDFSLNIEEGEFLTVISRSGCGKTTMLRMINGLRHRIQERSWWRGIMCRGRLDRSAEKNRVCNPE